MSYPPPYGYPAQGADATQAGYGYAADPYAAYYYNQQAYAADPNAAAYYNQYYAQYGAQVPQGTEEGEGAANADETSEGKRKAERSKKLDVHGNQESMNLAENVLVPVQSSDYFKSLYQYKTYHEVLQEIKNKVTNMETFIPNTRYASHAMCLMYKLFRMRITVKQMNGMLSNKDNPYVRAVGFLYLRLCAPPTQLWDFYKDYLLDPEVITLGVRGSRPSTIGKVVRELLTEPKFFDIFLPRFTVSQNKEFAQKLKEFDAANPSTSAKDKEDGEVVDRKRDRDNKKSRSKSRERKRSRSRERKRSRSRDRDGRRDNRGRRSNSRDRDSRRDRHSRSRSRDRRRSRSRDRDNRRRSRSRSRDRKRPREDDRDDRDNKRARNEESSSSTQKKTSNPAARAAIMSMYGASTEIKEDVSKKVGAWASDEEKFTLGSKRN